MASTVAPITPDFQTSVRTGVSRPAVEHLFEQVLEPFEHLI
jgi:hypothetical protein